MNIAGQQAFRDVVSCMDAAVNIITIGGPAGRAGSTAGAVCSVAGTLSTLLVYLNRRASVRLASNGNRALCVNTLSVEQESLSSLFGGRTPTEHRPAAARWQIGVTGYPQLEEALVSFDCRISQVMGVSAHNILFCVIEATHRHITPHGLMWFDRSYRALMHPAC